MSEWYSFPEKKLYSKLKFDQIKNHKIELLPLDNLKDRFFQSSLAYPFSNSSMEIEQTYLINSYIRNEQVTLSIKFSHSDLSNQNKIIASIETWLIFDYKGLEEGTYKKITEAKLKKIFESIDPNVIQKYPLIFEYINISNLKVEISEIKPNKPILDKTIMICNLSLNSKDDARSVKKDISFKSYEQHKDHYLDNIYDLSIPLFMALWEIMDSTLIKLNNNEDYNLKNRSNSLKEEWDQLFQERGNAIDLSAIYARKIDQKHQFLYVIKEEDNKYSVFESNFKMMENIESGLNTMNKDIVAQRILPKSMTLEQINTEYFGNKARLKNDWVNTNEKHWFLNQIKKKST